jgi:hypothetical protein
MRPFLRRPFRPKRRRSHPRAVLIATISYKKKLGGHLSVERAVRLLCDPEFVQ